VALLVGGALLGAPEGIEVAARSFVEATRAASRNRDRDGDRDPNQERDRAEVG